MLAILFYHSKSECHSKTEGRGPSEFRTPAEFEPHCISFYLYTHVATDLKLFLIFEWHLTSFVGGAVDQRLLLVLGLQVDQPGLLPAHKFTEKTSVDFAV